MFQNSDIHLLDVFIYYLKFIENFNLKEPNSKKVISSVHYFKGAVCLSKLSFLGFKMNILRMYKKSILWGISVKQRKTLRTKMNNFFGTSIN